MYKNELRNLLASIRLASLSQQLYVKFSKPKFNYNKLLGLLVTEGFISGFEKRNNFLVVYLKRSYSTSNNDNNSAFYDLKLTSRTNRKASLSNSRFCYIKKIKGPTELLFLMTDKNIINSAGPIKNFAGGFPLFLIK